MATNHHKVYQKSLAKKLPILVCLLITFFLFSLFGVTALADSDDTVVECDGCIFEAHPLNIYQPGISTFSTLPSSVDLSTTNYFPSIGKQPTNSNSCTAWATTYYQFTYEAARLNTLDAKHDNSKVFSPKYVNNYLSYFDIKGAGTGVSYDDCYQFLKAQGAVRWTEFPYTSKTFEWYQGSSESLQTALETRVSNYYVYQITEPNIETPITSNTDADLNGIKSLLNEGHVLTISTSIDGFKEGTLSNGEKAVTHVTNSGVHAMTIVGYNDNIQYDLNNNGTIESFEKGAFKVANSYGTAYRNNGYIWIMYDAVNKTSNVSTLNNNRIPAFLNYEYNYIQVANYTPQLMAEVTIQQKYRDDVNVTLGVGDVPGGPRTMLTTFLDGRHGGHIGFDGVNNTYQTRTMVFDYSSLYSNLNKIYWVDVRDYDSNNDSNATVQKIRWLNSNGGVIKEIGQQSALNGSTGNYSSQIMVSGISLSKSSSKLAINGSQQTVPKTEKLTATVTPTNATIKNVTWTSSNTNVVTVDANGNVTAQGTGTATVTARATDGSNKQASCTYTVVKLVSSISITRSSSAPQLLKGQTEQLNLSVGPSDATNKSVTWSSSNTSVLKVSQSGVITWAGQGTATITATAKDGSGVKGSIQITITDDYGNTSDTAYNVLLHSESSGKIDISGDADYFKFVPSETGKYLIYTTGSTDTVGYLYNSSNTLYHENDEAGISGNNFALEYNLVAGQTYYIKVCGYSTRTGAYTLVVSKAFYHSSINSDNQDARRVQMQAEGASVLTTLKIKIGSKTYTLNKPASGNLDVTVNGARFKVTFVSKNNGLSTTWKIEAKIPSTTVGTTDIINFTFSKGNISNIYGPSHTGFIAYKSSIKTGINPKSNLQALLNSMAQSGYSLTVRNWDNTLVVITSSTKAATGMKIIKTTTGGKIVEIFYVVLFGDVTGNGIVGDGIIDSDDYLTVLQSTVGQSELGTLAYLAADVDHDGSITAVDAQAIMQYTVGKDTINQNHTISEVPDDCYFLDPVKF